MVNLHCSKEDAVLIQKIAVRAVKLATDNKVEYSRLHCEMDLTAVHLNSNPLKLEELLTAPDSDFGHDVFGIRRFLDRETGRLRECFCPRYSKPITKGE